MVQGMGEEELEAVKGKISILIDKRQKLIEAAKG